MDPVVASHAQLLAVNATLINRALATLTDDEIWMRPGERSNSIGWLLGHVAWSRAALLRIIGGEPVNLPGGEVFARGAQASDRSAYPATADTVSVLKTVNERLKARMATMDEATLSAPSPFEVPIADKSVRGAVAFLTFHDSYHVGQIAYVLKWLGKPGLVG